MNQPKRYAIAADTILAGSTKHKDAAVVIEGSIIESVIPQSELPAGLRTRKLSSGTWLAPGFIDIQVNGGGDVLFNNSPTPEAILTMAAAHRKFGTTALLPTFITDTCKKMEAAVAAAHSLVGKEPSVLGIHLEGPFLSPERAGAHDPSLMRAPGPADLEILCADRVPKGFITRLVQSDVRVALGHSMATYNETRAAMAEGLTGFTHLFNAMRPLASREPGPVAAALESPNAWFGLIVDGFHVDPAMLRLALRGLAHPILVTDAMPPVGGRQSRFDLYAAEIRVVDGRCVRSDGTLAGAALDMSVAIRNCVRLLQVPLEDALRFASRNPAEFIGLGHMLGSIAPGYRADLVAIDPETLNVLVVWIEGIESE
jgi:N-acetylglucosamine-6-phosphate deacetylase